jgi:hypothetical protein
MRVSMNILTAVGALTVGAPAFAQFAPGPNPITDTVGAQTLSAGTGIVDSSGKISVTSGSTVALTLTGTSNLVNNGTIQTTGTGRAIDSNSGVANLNVTNNGLISSVSSDAFRVNTNSIVSLTNSGTIQVTNGGQAIDWAAITNQSNVLTNTVTGLITAVGEDAVRLGTGGILNNAGTILATPTGGASPTGSDGIDVRTFTGIQVNNGGSITGRHGIATDGSNSGPSTITVNNFGGGIVSGLNGSGLNIDGAFAHVTATVFNDFGGTFKGGVRAGATEADGDGIDVDGVLTLTNNGDVLGLGARGSSNNAEGIAAGGGTIVNGASGRIIGSSLLADAPNGDASKAGNGILIDNSNGGNAVAATTITNSGLIQGKSGFGIQIIGTFADTVTNNAGGTIRGAGTGATIQTGDAGDTVTNRGAIVSDTGNAIDLQTGNDQLRIEGGAASVIGNISGGAGNNTLTVDAGTGNNFAYAGVISSFDSVTVQSGNVTLSGANEYTGQTIVNDGTLILDGASRIASLSELVLNGGALEIDNASGANAQTFASLSLSGSSTIDLGLSSLTFNALGTIGGGSLLTVLNWSDTTSPSYAFRVLGDMSGNAAFLMLLGGTTINGLAAAFEFDGIYTNVKPVPIPGALALLLSGLGALGTMARRRKQT